MVSYQHCHCCPWIQWIICAPCLEPQPKCCEICAKVLSLFSSKRSRTCKGGNLEALSMLWTCVPHKIYTKCWLPLTLKTQFCATHWTFLHQNGETKCHETYIVDQFIYVVYGLPVYHRWISPFLFVQQLHHCITRSRHVQCPDLIRFASNMLCWQTTPF